MAPIHPEALAPGDAVAIVAPSGPAAHEPVALARTRLEQMGFRVRVADDVDRRRGYLAGDDERRAAELMDAFRDPSIKAIFAATGGYGTTRMLDRLDYDVIRANPKVFVGFSNITGLHLAIQKRAGLVTFHGPNLTSGLGRDDNLSTLSARWLWRAILAEQYVDVKGEPLPPGYAYEFPADAGTLQVIHRGKARGRLTGGNLSLICPLIGTPYEIETKDRILFIEDVHEEPYRIDRYLSHLRLAGKLDGVAGVIFGRFSDCEPQREKISLTLEQVFRDYFEDRGIPVILNFPAGHVRDNATLPMNALIELDADAPRVTVLENPVHPPRKSGGPTAAEQAP